MERRAQNLAKLAARTGNDPSMTQIAAQADQIFPQMAAAIAAQGLDANNVADVYAVWWISAYDAANGHTGTRPRAIYQAVRDQAAHAVLATPQLAGADDALKQEMAEALLAHTIAIDVTVEHAKNDPQQLRAIGNAVRQGAQAMGINLADMTLTDQGFVIGD